MMNQTDETRPAAAGMSAGTRGDMGGMAGMDAAHAALMEGMDTMMQDMAAGSMAPDFDVAFVASMMPHHRGAIAMAEAELKYGKDPAARQLAQSIVDEQNKQVDAMKKWLEEQPKGQ